MLFLAFAGEGLVRLESRGSLSKTPIYVTRGQAGQVTISHFSPVF